MGAIGCGRWTLGRGWPVVAWGALVSGLAGAQGRPSPETDASEYHVGRGDSLHVQVYEEPTLTGEVVVNDACAISLGLVGSVQVCDLTLSEVEREITRRYAGDYLVSPSVAVRVIRYHSQRVDVLGEVEKPGPQYLEGQTSLVEVLSLAGGPRADNVVQVEIVGVDGAVRRYDLNRLPTEEDVLVREGDRIYLRPGELVYVEGQIAHPGAVLLTPGLTVTQALTLAGGPDETANLRRVQINRADGSIVRINVSRVHKGYDEDVVLTADDHLIVPRSPF